MKKPFLALCFAVCSASLCAQFSNNYSLPTITQPSPNAVSLGKYGDVPVSYYNGMPQISIPLLSIKTKSGFELPVELSYHASGVKLDDMPSSVGMNWSLNAGGVIAKTTRGRDDFGLTSTTSEGYYWTEERDFDFNQPMAGCIFSDRCSRGEFDNEADLFYYNVTGASGKFVFKTDKSILQLPYKNMDIQVQNLSYPVNGSTKPTWVINDADGNRYNFGVNGVEMSQIVSVSPSLPFTSSYFLTEIQTKAPSESIVFEYTDYVHQYAAGTGHTHGLGILAAPGNGGACAGNVFDQNTSSVVKSYSKLLSRIIYKGYTIEFVYSSSGITSLVQKLDQVIYKYNEIVYRKFQLQYAIELSKDRFWLTKIIDEDITNGNTNNLYTISYQSYASVPQRLSGYCDKFGYYNQNTTPNKSPKIPGQSYSYPTVNTDPDVNYMLYGAIDEISFPTKGRTKFVFESHYYKASDADPTVYNGAGIRVKEILGYEDATTTTPFKRELFFYDDGKIMVMPNPYHYYTSGCVGGNTCMYIMSATTSNVSLSNSAMGSMVGYGKVTKMLSGLSGTPNGKEEFEYSNNRPALPYASGGSYTPGMPNDPLRLIPPGTPCSETVQSSQNGFLLSQSIYAYNGSAYLLTQKTTTTPDPDAPSDGMNCTTFRSPECPSEPAYSDPTFCPRIVSAEYAMNAKVTRPISKETQTYDLVSGVPTSNYTTITELYEYDKLQVSKQTVTKSNAQAITVDKTFASHALPYFSYNAPLAMKKRIGGILTEDIEYSYHGSEPTLIEQVKYKEIQALGTAGGNTTLLNNQSNVIYEYNGSNELKNIVPYNALSIGYLWDNDLGKLMAEAKNAKQDDIAYTSFESSNASGRFSFATPGVNTTARTGNKGYALGGSNALSTSVTSPGVYKITFWTNSGFSGAGISLNNGNVVSQFSETYTGNSWTFWSFTVNVNGTCNISVTGSGTIDEIKLHPETAMMSSYVHHPFYGLLSANDDKAALKTFSYDAFGRLYSIKDHDGTVLQVLKYNLK